MSETTTEVRTGSTEAIEVISLTMTVRIVVGTEIETGGPDVVGRSPPRTGKIEVITGTTGRESGKSNVKLVVGIAMMDVAPSRSDVTSPRMTDAGSEVAALSNDESNDVGRMEGAPERTDPSSEVTEPRAEVTAPVEIGPRMEVASVSMDPMSEVKAPAIEVTGPKAEVTAPVLVGLRTGVTSVSMFPISEVKALTIEVGGFKASLLVVLDNEEDKLVVDEEEERLLAEAEVVVGAIITLRLDEVAAELTEGTAIEIEMLTAGIEELLVELLTRLVDSVVETGATITGCDELEVTTELVRELEATVKLKGKLKDKLKGKLVVELEAVVAEVVGTGTMTTGFDELEVVTELVDELEATGKLKDKLKVELKAVVADVVRTGTMTTGFDKLGIVATLVIEVVLELDGSALLMMLESTPVGKLKVGRLSEMDPEGKLKDGKPIETETEADGSLTEMDADTDSDMTMIGLDELDLIEVDLLLENLIELGFVVDEDDFLELVLDNLVLLLLLLTGAAVATLLVELNTERLLLGVAAGLRDFFVRTLVEVECDMDLGVVDM